MIKDEVINIGTCSIPSNLLDFQKWTLDIINKIPEEYRKDARIGIDTEEEDCDEDCDDCSYATVEVYYYRPETEEERLKEEREMIIAEEKNVAWIEYQWKLREIEAKYADHKD